METQSQIFHIILIIMKEGGFVLIYTSYPNKINFIPLVEQNRIFKFSSRGNRKKKRPINEGSVNNHLRLGEPINVEKFVKANNIQRVSDPIFFVRDGIPSPNGLLSYEIFGITKEERAGTYGYIDLGDWFMHPLVYKKWTQKDRRIKDIVHGIKKFSLDSSGNIVEDEKGYTGIKFLKDNIDKIKIKRTDSKERDDIIDYIYKYKDVIFMKKMIVMPAYYRDVQSKSGGRVGVGDLNKLYQSLIISSNSLSETQDYGLSMDDAIKGKMQETILAIYNSITGTSGDDTDGVGLSKKTGLVRSAIMSKTTDYGTRLILSAPELKVETLDDMMVDLDYSAVPLSSACVNFMPFVIFNMKRFFENEFSNGSQMRVIYKGKLTYMEVKDPLITFSEDELKKQIKRYVLGFSNRYAPVEVPLVNGKTGYLSFKGKRVNPKDIVDGNVVGEHPLVDRRLTWCDVIYMATVEAVKDKHVVITRYPIDSCYNTIYTKVRVSTTKETEGVYVNGEYYRWYPKIREDDIGKNTSNRFIDTLCLSNLHLKGLGGDYDGDSVTLKGVWFVESNDEIDKLLKSKKLLVNIGGSNIKISGNEAIQSLYSLTKVLPGTKLTDPVF